MAPSDDGWDSFDRYRDESLPLQERKAAFEQLFNSQLDYAMRAARTVLLEICDNKPPRGADLEQMAMDALYILEKKSSMVDGSPKSFLWGVLRNLARRFKAKGDKLADRRALTYETLVRQPGAGDPASDAEDAILEERQLVSEAITKLSRAQQEVIDLHDFEGLGFPEIDQRLGLRPGGARQRHCRARLRLAELLAKPITPAPVALVPKRRGGPTVD